MDAFQRIGINARIRWQIFNRDNFTCQYCGRNTKNEKNLRLEIDHVIPVIEGGNNDLKNLLTSCYDCNHGKRDDKLSIPDIKKRIETKTETFIDNNTLRKNIRYRHQHVSFSLTQGHLDIIDAVHINRSEALRIIIQFWFDGHKKLGFFKKIRK